ncbi:MAG: peptidase T, partial [Oscillospiraceae bacterium]|nr:peptidase T [Oscillospiraceae bacterium]
DGIAAFLNTKYGPGTVTITKYRGYENMKEKILPHMHLIDNAMLAMERAGVTAKICAIRGGTDGATLSYRGLPCPNLCTGGYNYHGRFEYIPVQSMEKMQEVLLNIVDIYAGN